MKQTSETAFEPEWLSLREPADHAARNADLLARAARLIPEGKVVLDLGSGTGSTARAFAQVGLDDLTWHFIDNDPALLKIAGTRHPEAVCVVQDVSKIEDIPLDGVGLITASALFDLMTAEWMEALLTRASPSRVPIYAALSYDGQMAWSPADQRDASITEAFNTHQRSDKGLGPALGPDATATFERLCDAFGYRVETAQSPWCLGPVEAKLHAALLDGIAHAAQECGAPDAPGWARARQEMVAQSRAHIGHTDLLAVPK